MPSFMVLLFLLVARVECVVTPGRLLSTAGDDAVAPPSTRRASTAASMKRNCCASELSAVSFGAPRAVPAVALLLRMVVFNRAAEGVAPRAPNNAAWNAAEDDDDEAAAVTTLSLVVCGGGGRGCGCWCCNNAAARCKSCWICSVVYAATLPATFPIMPLPGSTTGPLPRPCRPGICRSNCCRSCSCWYCCPGLDPAASKRYG